MDQVDILLPKWEPGGSLPLPGHPHEVAGPLSGGGREKVLRKNLVNIIYHCRWLSSMESSRSPILLDHPWQDSWLIRLEISGDCAERETGD